MKTLNIEGIIGRKNDTAIGKGEKSFSFDDLEAFLASNGAEPFDVVIKSPGGSVEEGFRIYDALKVLDVTTTALTANSIASVIFLAGKVRKVTPATEIIIHNAWVDGETLVGEKLNYHTLTALTEIFAETDIRILDVYSEIAGPEKASKLLALMAEETNLGADMALDLGFATEKITDDAKAYAFKNRVLTYCKNQIDLLNIQDGPVTTYADTLYVNSENKVLILQRKEDDSFEPLKWGFPGGKVMQGETTEAAALREFSEETGLEVLEALRLCELVNSDESISHYFAASGNDNPLSLPEHAAYKFVGVEELGEIAFIKDQKERFEKLIKDSLTKTLKLNMDNKEKVNAFEKMLTGIKNLFKASFKNMAVATKEGVALFIAGAEDGELLNKVAYLAEEGLPTDEFAPAGPHTLEDGTVIVVGEAGVITEVTAAEMPAEVEDVEALKAAFDKEKTEMLAAFEEEKKAFKAQIENLTSGGAEAKAKLSALVLDFEKLKNEIVGDPDKKKKPVTLSNEDFAKLSPGDKIKARAMAKADAVK